MYFKRLDTIRCYAVLMIFLANIFWFENWNNNISYLFPLGQAGLIILFVMSGFLITRSLVSEPKNKSVVKCLKEFYLRRALKIFPIYYLFLTLCYFANIGEIRSYGFDLWLCLGNIHIFNHNRWMGGYSHLFTLAVQVQFYLVWPFLILFLRARLLLLLVLFFALILIAVHTKLALLIGGFSEKQVAAFPISNLDFFAVGGLVALGDIYYQRKFKIFGLLPFLIGSAYYQRKFKIIGYMLLVVGLCAYLEFYYLFQYLSENKLFFVINQLLLSLLASGLIIVSIYSSMEPKSIFHNKFTMYFGKISYGIYLYHYFVIAHFAKIAGAVGIKTTDSIYIYFKIILSFVITLALAELSFRLIEEPILRFKDKFRSK